MLLHEIQQLEFKLDGSGAEMAFPPSGGIPAKLWNFPTLLAALEEIAVAREQKLLNLMINRLKPGVDVSVHRDWIKPTQYQPVKPTVERWHLAVITNPDAVFWLEKAGDFKIPQGFWYGPIPYWLNHTVYNKGTEDRIHLVVDLDTPTPIGKYAEDF